jgi:hydrogenase maturation protease
MSWEAMERPGPASITVDGVELRPGSRVRLRPQARADVFDVVLAGRTARLEAIEQSLEDAVHLVVSVDDDPGRDLADAPLLGHRFFFSPDEVEPLPPARILVAGVGNVFLGDDGFGVALAGRLAERTLPPGVEVVDFGIRGMDLAYALGEGWNAVVLLDAAPTGAPPGTLSVIEPEIDAGEPALDAHGMDPVKVLALAGALGGPLPRTLVVACAPAVVPDPDEDVVVAELSEPVRAAIDAGVELVDSLLRELTAPEPEEDPPS